MDRFEHFTLSVFSITRYWNKIATEEMRRNMYHSLDIIAENMKKMDERKRGSQNE